MQPLAHPAPTADHPGGAPPGVVGAAAARWIASPNLGPRQPAGVTVDVVVLHSTCMPTNALADTARRFESPASGVSAHYLVDKEGQVVQMVSESDRAWHAGVCRWRGRDDLNSCSIGIEMLHRDQEAGDTWPGAQITAVAALLRDIRRRHDVPDEHVVFHSEIAYPPGRKSDPAGFDRPLLLRVAARAALATAPEAR